MSRNPHRDRTHVSRYKVLSRLGGGGMGVVYAQRDGGFSEMKGDPLLKNLESDPRYNAFLRKLKLPV